MENYHVNRSCGRPYHATCGMAKAQMAARSSSCPCTEQHKNQSCACRMPNTVTINPEMYTHADHMEPAMAYVPCQQLTTTYDLCYALNVGTIFPAALQTILRKERWTKMMYQNSSGSKAQLLQKINEVSFAVNDILLYLDTHPCCEKGMALYREYAAERKKLMKEYAQCYGPLTVDDALESDGNTWKWMEQPFPWETEGGCR